MAHLRVAEAMPSAAEEALGRVRDHLASCAAMVENLPSFPLPIVETARAMALALAELGDRRSSAYETLFRVGRGTVELRTDSDGQNYAFDDFFDFYGPEKALERWRQSPRASPASRIYSKRFLLALRSLENSDDDDQWRITLVDPLPTKQPTPKKKQQKKQPPRPSVPENVVVKAASTPGEKEQKEKTLVLSPTDKAAGDAATRMDLPDPPDHFDDDGGDVLVNSSEGVVPFADNYNKAK